MWLYGDGYIFANKEPTRFYIFMKTDVSTDKNKDELSFKLFVNQFYNPVFEKSSKNDTSQDNICVKKYTSQHCMGGKE